jgi:hypothetical protein
MHKAYNAIAFDARTMPTIVTIKSKPTDDTLRPVRLKCRCTVYCNILLLMALYLSKTIVL